MFRKNQENRKAIGIDFAVKDQVFKRDKGIILSPAEREAEEASALFLES